MSVDPNPYAIIHALAAVLTALLALTVYAAAPARAQNRRLAVHLGVSVVVMSMQTIMYGATDPADVYAASVLIWPAVLLYGIAYLRFLAVFTVPPTRALQHRWGDRALLALMALAVLAGLATASTLIRSIVPFQPFVPFRPEWGPALDAVLRVIAAISVYGVVVTVWAWRRARPGSALRDQMAWYAGAAIVFDVLQVARLAILFPIITSAVRAGTSPPAWVVQSTLASVGVAFLVFAAMLAYAMLHTQVFDIHLRLKRNISRSTVAAVFVAVFIAVVEVGSQVLLDETGSLVLGGVAIALLVLAIQPLQRLGDRVADKAMPEVQDTPEYRAERAREIFAAAVESAMEDGEITDKERSMLATLAEKFNLRHTEALAIEREVVAAGGGA